jgi:V8-like Glu-specific endopeptidase
MGRGKSFQHKRKGHQPESPEHGKEVHVKNEEHAQYSIDTVASENGKPVTIKSE